MSSCKPTVPPTCTAVSIRDLAWDIHHEQEYYITIRVNNTAGLISRQCSKPYKHDVLAPFAGIVIDIDPNAPQKVSILQILKFVKFHYCFVFVFYTFSEEIGLLFKRFGKINNESTIETCWNKNNIIIGAVQNQNVFSRI